MITPGEQYLAYIGVPDDYPRGNELATEVSDAIFDAAVDVLAEWKRTDPLLRAMLDDRCALWTWAPVEAGSLPLGTLIEYAYGDNTRRGQVGEHKPDFYDGPDRVRVRWEVDGWPPALPDIAITATVEARVPVPFDLSALVEARDAG